MKVGKKIARRFLELFCYYSGIDVLFYFLNRRAKKIVTFHNVLPDSICQKVASVGVSNTLSQFTAIIDEISRRFRFSTDVNDTCTVTITFDDGTLNEYEIAGKELMKRNIPAILFVTGDIVGARGVTMPIIEQVCVWTSFVPENIARKAFGEFTGRTELWQKHIQPGFRADAAKRGRTFLQKLNEIYPVKKILESLPAEWNRLRMSGVDESNLNDLKVHGWQIGWHTKTHFPLACLSVDERVRELNCSPDMKKVVLGYPYGDITSVGVETIGLVPNLGYPCAVSNTDYYSPYHGKYFMPRMALSDDRYSLHFVLSGVKYFLKNGKLLPGIGD